MSTKIFVHKPLKRAELKRLHEEPRPLEASPGPTVSRLEPLPDPEKAKRAQERLQRRDDQRNAGLLLARLAEYLRPVMVPGPAFLRWLIEGLDGSDDSDTFINSSNLVTLIRSVEECIVCGAKNPVAPRGSTFLVWPNVFEETTKNDKSTIGAVACPRCAKLQPKLYARVMARQVLAKDKAVVRRRLCKFSLLDGDRQMLEWLERPRPGSDDATVDRALKTGVFNKVLEGVERIIEKDNNWLGQNFRKFTASDKTRSVGKISKNIGQIRQHPILGSI